MEGPICLVVEKMDETKIWFRGYETFQMPITTLVSELCERFKCKRAYGNSIPFGLEDHRVIDWKFDVGSPKDRLRYVYALEAERNRLLKNGCDKETRKFFKRCMEMIKLK